ncbi:unnamed protein product [Durusdinium trenchii]|uniref:Uncharacterized protein n=1 Tax=Durusdinium trenchii TaxID=1381693 RepID=A0ABP0S240_9DINO
MESVGCPGMCISPTGSTWSDQDVVLSSCENVPTSNNTDDHTGQRFYFHAEGFVQNQWSAKCLDSNSDGVVGWTECELEVSCNKKGMKFDPLNMDGAGANAELRIEKTEQPKG